MGEQAKRLDGLVIDTWWRLTRFLNLEHQGSRALDGLTSSDLKIMRGLMESPLSMTAVAGMAGVTRGTATGMIDRLVEGGLAERFEDASNRRFVLVRLAEEGRELFQSVHLRACQRASIITRRLSPEERRELERLLRRINQIVVEEAEKEAA